MSRPWLAMSLTSLLPFDTSHRLLSLQGLTGVRVMTHMLWELELPATPSLLRTWQKCDHQWGCGTGCTGWLHPLLHADCTAGHARHAM
eukprot:1136258-Pelagomonas_calceolata.AAC.1